MQIRSQKLAMRSCFGGLGALPTALQNFAFFCKNNLSFSAILIKKMILLKRGIQTGSANIIKVVAIMVYLGGG